MTWEYDATNSKVISNPRELLQTNALAQFGGQPSGNFVCQVVMVGEDSDWKCNGDDCARTETKKIRRQERNERPARNKYRAKKDRAIGKQSAKNKLDEDAPGYKTNKPSPLHTSTPKAKPNGNV